ncbi:AGC protein kinase [Aphanomyces invadans]|uniref:AGC protein kinase n=1 Tax=Aphanomyces invadans TaxID=157072 RepID=A0A024U193_9STRA|nr:AGC protein kinase [Aphanomyces invadans]ETV99969.1 AGC protein kinase [Aphanomyces invadans]|eukprot:XP_008871387.1 AGC protein kinase [Aphanomyces invadans]
MGSGASSLQRRGSTTGKGGGKAPSKMTGRGVPAPLVAANTQWKMVPQTISRDKSLKSLDEAELNNMLNDPVGQKHIGNYAKKILTSESFYCWIEILEFRDAPSSGYQRSVAKHIYKKYIREGASMALGGLTREMVADYDQKLAVIDTALINQDFFAPIQKLCFDDMCRNTYHRFKSSPEFDLYKLELKDTYNKVTVDDFDYLELLGSGGFGRVVHARKKSTGKHYAMKIQLKNGLLHEHQDQLDQITSEKDILQICNHPYILDMHYSFQTSAHAIIVTELVRGGDLNELMKTSKKGYLPEGRVRLYAAEIALALNHLHELGLIYRDLKPCNVLLGEDGHIVLADMGLATGLEEIRAKKREKERLAANESKDTEEAPASSRQLTDAEEQKRRDEENAAPSTNSQLQNIPKSFARPPDAKYTRRKTTVGTKGYMAPELISGKLLRREERPGYNYTIDYWSLGVTVYELVCGYQPFNLYNVLGDGFLAEIAQEVEVAKLSPRSQYRAELERMAAGVDYPEYVSEDVRDFINKLLDVNASSRMGCTARGFLDIMEHPYFKDLDWERLMVKHVQPEFTPTVKPLTDRKTYSNFWNMMAHFDARDKHFIRHDWYQDPPPEKQKAFEHWDYISPHTLKAELGIAAEMDESNRPYKILQLTGETAG